MTTDSPASSAAFDALRLSAAGLRAELGALSAASKSADRDAQRFSRSLASALGRAFDQAAFKGRKLSDVLRDLAFSVARSAFSTAIGPLSDAVGASLGRSLGGTLSGVGGGLGGLLSGLFGGGVASGVRRFAAGGVFDGAGVLSNPAAFGFRGGVGLLGEAGPEAILPLRRGPDGRLGVSAPAGAAQTPISIVIQTPDAASFQRSRAQVAAQLTRALDRGRRNL